MTRTDSPLIKHLASGAAVKSLEAAAVYNALPLFVMPEEASELLSNEMGLLDAIDGPLRLPFTTSFLTSPSAQTLCWKP